MDDVGTTFTPPALNSQQQIETWLRANFSPAVVPEAVLNKAIEATLLLYPNDPALGSPFDTGNDTFGLDPEFKRMSAIFGDYAFQALRRTLSDLYASYGIPNFAYLFTDPQPSLAPFYGGEYMLYF